MNLKSRAFQSRLRTSASGLVAGMDKYKMFSPAAAIEFLKKI
jgi:hypothetical protein